MFLTVSRTAILHSSHFVELEICVFLVKLNLKDIQCTCLQLKQAKTFLSKDKYKIIIYIAWRQEKVGVIRAVGTRRKLRKFILLYVIARNASGDYYSRNTMKAVRSRLDRYLSSSPYRKPFSISRDPSIQKGERSFECTRLSNKPKLQPL